MPTTDNVTKKEDDAFALIPATGTSVVKFGDRPEIQMQMRIMRAAVNGLSAKKKEKINNRWVEVGEYLVSDELVLSLYIMERQSGLRASRGELHAIPGIGISVAAKVRAADALREAARWGNPLKITFAAVLPGSALWKEYEVQYSLHPKDTVAACQIEQTTEYKAWMAKRSDYAKLLKEVGIVGIEALDHIDERFGQHPPVNIALGVVKHSESFDKTWVKENPSEWDKEQARIKAEIKEAVYPRIRRAEKRAFSAALASFGLAAPDTRNYGPVQPVEDLDQTAAVIQSSEFKELPAAGETSKDLAPVPKRTVEQQAKVDHAARNLFGSGKDDDLLAGNEPPPVITPPTDDEMSADLLQAVAKDGATGRMRLDRELITRDATRELFDAYIAAAKSAVAVFGADGATADEKAMLSAWKQNWAQPEAAKIRATTAIIVDELNKKAPKASA